MAFEKIPEEKRRLITVEVALNKYEHFLLKSIALRLDLPMSATLRRLIEEDNERHHYDLIEPEWARQRNRGLAKITD